MTDKLNHNPQPELSERDTELLSAYIDEMLSEDERQALEARLVNDTFLRAELAAMRQTVAWMNALPILKAPRDFTITAADIAPIKKAPQRKLIPMQNRNWWYAASAAAIVIVVIGLIAILPSISNMTAPKVGDSAAELAALPSATAMTSEAQLQTFAISTDMTSESFAFSENAADVADAEEANDGANVPPADTRTESTSDLAEVLPQVGNTTTTNMQAPAPDDTSLRSAEPLSQIQLTATALSDLFASTPTQAPSMIIVQTQSLGQGGGVAQATDPSPLPASIQSAPDTDTSDDDANTLSVPQSGGGMPAELATGADESVEEEQAESTGSVAFNAADSVEETDDPSTLGDVDDTVGVEGESGLASLEMSSNLVTATLEAVRAFIQSLQP